MLCDGDYLVHIPVLLVYRSEDRFHGRRDMLVTAVLVPAPRRPIVVAGYVAVVPIVEEVVHYAVALPDHGHQGLIRFVMGFGYAHMPGSVQKYAAECELQ